MASPTPPPSSRLRRAAEAERAELAKHRAKLLKSQETLRGELDRVEAALDELGDRERLLDQLAGPAEIDRVEGAATATSSPTTSSTEAPVPLRGPDIRRVAVEVLLSLPGRPEALHYRDWLQRVVDSGYQVLGKDPNAVFLSQISRSPVIKRGTKPGVYSLDRGAPQRLRSELARAHRQLADLPSTPTDAQDLRRIREARTALNNQIDHLERDLAEAEALLSRESSIARLAVAG